MPANHRRRFESRGASAGRARLSAVAVLVLTTLMVAGAAPLAVLAETPGASPNPESIIATGPVTLGETVTFHGRGYGHGVGMSQYGARGRAQAGEDAATILGHYYQGATLAAIDPATPIRVLVLSKWADSAEKPLVVYGRVGPWSIDEYGVAFPPDARLRLFAPAAPAQGVAVVADTPWRLLVEGADGAVLLDEAAPASFAIRSTAPESRLQLWSKPTIFDKYRGSLRVIIHSTTRVSVVNDVPLDEYLAGVVPVEMPPTWPAAALQAQSIAARSYAARRLRPGLSYFDVPDDSTSQIYRGIRAEKATTSAAIAATAGTVLMSGTTIINALFHSTGGGATESNENVYTSATGKRTGKPVSYLRGVPDRRADGTPYDSSAPHATWTTRTYTRAQLSAWFAANPRTNVGDLLAIDLHDRGVSGRLVSVTLIGTTGSRTVSGEVFRAVFNARRPPAEPSLKSTLLDTVPIP